MKRLDTLHRVNDANGGEWGLLTDPDNYVVGKISIVNDKKEGRKEYVMSPHYYGRLPKAILGLAEAIAKQDATDLHDLVERYERVAEVISEATKGL